MNEGLHPTAVGKEFRRPICPRGHDKRVTGIGPHHFCRVCRNAAVRKRQTRERREAGVLPVNAAPVPSLRYWRIEADLTQLVLAEAAGLTKYTIICLEAGRPSSLAIRQRIAAVLGVQPGVLVMRPPGEPKKKRAGYGPRRTA